MSFLNNLSFIKKADWQLNLTVFFLVIIGLVSLYSLSLNTSNELFIKQSIFAVIGFALLILFSVIDYRWLNNLAKILYIFSILLLILVLFFGTNLKGTTGWFVWQGLSFQPIELAKISIIIILAKFFSENFHKKNQFPAYLESFLIILPILFLSFIQPDFGSMFIVLLVWAGTLWLFGVNKKHFIFLILFFIIFSFITWGVLLQDYQKTRILSFVNPRLDLSGAGYNTWQSIVAIGSGGLFGKGLGFGTQSLLNFLPVSEADFIFSSIVEQLGFVFSITILILFFIFYFRLYKICKNTKDSFGVFLVFAACLMFFLQTIINIGMAIGLTPVTGLPLPFISYGGSFLVISLILIGIIQSIKIKNT
jgi:rod shape determining protein RodA